MFMMKKYFYAVNSYFLFWGQFSFKFSEEKDGEPQYVGVDADLLKVTIACHVHNLMIQPDCSRDKNIISNFGAFKKGTTIIGGANLI
jgi:hypothetical protein